MHILYLHQYFVPPGGSGGTRSYEMARRFVKAGHKVTMVTSSAFFPKHYTFKKLVNSIEIEGIDLKVIKVPYSNKLPFSKRMRAFLKFAVIASYVVTKIRHVDVVFATSTPLTITIPAIVAKFWHRRPMVFEVRDLWPELPIAVGALKNPLLIYLAKKLEKTAYKNAKRIVALSPGMKEGVVKTGYPEERVVVIPNSCDVQLFNVPESFGKKFLMEHPYLQGGPLVTYAGTLGKINGVSYLVEIAERMLKIDPNVRFLIVGDGQERELVRKKAVESGVLEKNLWMLPPFPKKEMPYILSATTVATSLFINLREMWNNSANKFFDALAAGRPVMINYGGWQAELLKQTGAGIVVPPDDPEQAAELLYKFLCDREKLEKAKKAALKLAMNEFDRDKLAEKLRRILEEAATS